MARTAAYSKALKTAKMWEKRARAKDRRLANAANLDAYSPTWGATPNLEDMNIHELRRYAHTLNEYVSERFRKLPSGELVSNTEYRQLKSLVKRENRRRRNLRESIENVEGGEGLTSVNDNLSRRMRVDPNTLQPISGPWGSGSPLEPIRITQTPRTRASFDRLRQAMKEVLSRPDTVLYDRYRRGAVGMAAQTGDINLVKAINSLTDRQLMFAVERMGLIESLSLIYTPKQDIEAGLTPTSDLLAESAADRAGYTQEDLNDDEILAEVFDDYNSSVDSIAEGIWYLKNQVRL